jgi:hypothetical protein
MSDLHSQIMNLPCKYEAAWQTPSPSDWVEGYVNGYRDTRHAAAELALSQSSRIVRLEEALKSALTDLQECGMELGASPLSRLAKTVRNGIAALEDKK